MPESLTAWVDLRLFGCVYVRRWLPGSAALAFLVAAGCAGAPPAPGGWELTSLSGRKVRWVPAPETRAVVFMFLGVECPISNRAQPELTQLARQFAPQVEFVAVYPNAGETAAMVRRHRTEFKLPPTAYRDPQQHLADALQVTVTPEVAALTVDGRLIYRGRVNDQFAGLGRGRPEATRHDLSEALTAFLSGQPPAGTVTKAAGCHIDHAP